MGASVRNGFLLMIMALLAVLSTRSAMCEIECGMNSHFSSCEQSREFARRADIHKHEAAGESFKRCCEKEGLSAGLVNARAVTDWCGCINSASTDVTIVTGSKAVERYLGKSLRVATCFDSATVLRKRGPVLSDSEWNRSICCGPLVRSLRI